MKAHAHRKSGRALGRRCTTLAGANLHKSGVSGAAPGLALLPPQWMKLIGAHATRRTTRSGFAGCHPRSQPAGSAPRKSLRFHRAAKQIDQPPLGAARLPVCRVLSASRGGHALVALTRGTATPSIGRSTQPPRARPGSSPREAHRYFFASVFLASFLATSSLTVQSIVTSSPLNILSCTELIARSTQSPTFVPS